MLVAVIAIVLVAVLAFANGANDNSKGVATLVGFGAARSRQALLWATLTTALGAGVSFWFAGGLIAAFKAKLFLAGTPLDTPFFVAVLIGASAWIALATVTGMPVSTTHAILGALLGAGLAAYGSGQIVWMFLATAVAVPLVLSPLISAGLVYVLARPVALAARRSAERCVCVTRGVVAPDHGGAAVAVAAPALVRGTIAECAAADPVAMVTGKGNLVHWASGGLVGFARGWNDAPKIAALGLLGFTAAGIEHPAAWGFLMVTLAMAAGGLVAGRRVLDTLARKLTPLPLAESLTASLTTASLVAAASWAGLPVSTTHVSTGAIIGAGLRNNPAAVKWGKVAEIVLSWTVTLPVAALLAGLVMWALRLRG